MQIKAIMREDFKVQTKGNIHIPSLATLTQIKSAEHPARVLVWVSASLLVGGTLGSFLWKAIWHMPVVQMPTSSEQQSHVTIILQTCTQGQHRYKHIHHRKVCHSSRLWSVKCPSAGCQVKNNSFCTMESHAETRKAGAAVLSHLPCSALLPWALVIEIHDLWH